MSPSSRRPLPDPVTTYNVAIATRQDNCAQKSPKYLQCRPDLLELYRTPFIPNGDNKMSQTRLYSYPAIGKADMVLVNNDL